jgi:hypothetical protein
MKQLMHAEGYNRSSDCENCQLNGVSGIACGLLQTSYFYEAFIRVQLLIIGHELDRIVKRNFFFDLRVRVLSGPHVTCRVPFI